MISPYKLIQRVNKEILFQLYCELITKRLILLFKLFDFFIVFVLDDIYGYFKFCKLAFIGIYQFFIFFFGRWSLGFEFSFLFHLIGANCKMRIKRISTNANDMLCKWIGIPYEVQLERKQKLTFQVLTQLKTRIVQDAFQRKMENRLVPDAMNRQLLCNLLNIVPNPMLKGHLNSMDLHFGVDPVENEIKTCGVRLQSKNLNLVLSVKNVDVLNSFQKNVMDEIEGWLNRSSLPIQISHKSVGIWNSVEIHSNAMNEFMIVVNVNLLEESRQETLNQLEILSKFLHDIPDLSMKSFYYKLGGDFHLLSGDSHLTHRVNGCLFEHRPQNRLENTLSILPQIIQQLQEWVNVHSKLKDVIIADLGCGIGMESILLSNHAVVGMDTSFYNIKTCIKNNQLNKRSNTYLCGDTCDLMRNYLSRVNNPIIVLLRLDLIMNPIRMIKMLRDAPQVVTIIVQTSKINQSENDIFTLLDDQSASKFPFVAIQSRVFDTSPHTPDSTTLLFLTRIHNFE
jgi:tRNA/tmRNA/rRNA uracil-C5-methylase (TrmA/RlmC/RlmD family)